MQIKRCSDKKQNRGEQRKLFVLLCLTFLQGRAVIQSWKQGLTAFQMQGLLNSLPAIPLISQNPTLIFRHGILLLEQCWGIFPPMWGVVRLYFKGQHEKKKGQHVNFSSINIQKMEYCIDIWYINKLIRTVE